MAPDEVRGRVFASDFMFFYLGSALASSLVGAALDTSLSISAIIWAMGHQRSSDRAVDAVGVTEETGGGLSVVSKPGKLEPRSPKSVGPE